MNLAGLLYSVVTQTHKSNEYRDGALLCFPDWLYWSLALAAGGLEEKEGV